MTSLEAIDLIRSRIKLFNRLIFFLLKHKCTHNQVQQKISSVVGKDLLNSMIASFSIVISVLAQSSGLSLQKKVNEIWAGRDL